MKTPIQRIFILRPAIRTQRKTGHAGEGSVVGQTAGYAVSRAAVRTVGKGVAVTSVLRVEHIRQTFVTYGDIRTDQDSLCASAARAFLDEEDIFPFLLKGCSLAFQRDNTRQRRQFGTQSQSKAVQFRTVPLNVDAHAAIGIAHRSGKPAFQRKPIHMRTEAYPLYLPGYGEHVSCLCRRNFFFHMPSVARRGAGARGEGRLGSPGFFPCRGQAEPVKFSLASRPGTVFIQAQPRP